MAAAVIDSLADRILSLENHENYRFIDVNGGDTLKMIELQKNKNTAKLTECHMRLFTLWLSQRSEFRNPEDLAPNELDLHIAQFLLGVRKQSSGTATVDLNSVDRQYEPQTLSAMHSSIYRYLSNKGYGVNIKQDDRFRHSREVLAAKMKELKSLGKGNLPNVAQPFTDDEIRIFVQKDLMGTSEFLFCTNFKLVTICCIK